LAKEPGIHLAGPQAFAGKDGGTVAILLAISTQSSMHHLRPLKPVIFSVLLVAFPRSPRSPYSIAFLHTIFSSRQQHMRLPEQGGRGWKCRNAAAMVACLPSSHN
jgi:hypothetical protein